MSERKCSSCFHCLICADKKTHVCAIDNEDVTNRKEVCKAFSYERDNRECRI